MMIDTNVMLARAAVTLKLAVAVGAAVHDVLDDGMLRGVQHRVVYQADKVEQGYEADDIRTQNKDEEGKDQRRPGLDELVSHVGKDDRIPDELHDEL